MTILSSLVAQAGVAGEAARGGYQISRSLRFNSADTAYLNRTPGSAGNRKTWTFSFWTKRSTLGAEQRILFSNDNGLAHATIEFTSGDALVLEDYTDPSPDYKLITTQLFRDVSAWYHIVAVFDTTNATSGDRLRLYVNGSRITSFSAAVYPTQNFDGYTNNNVPHGIGARIASPVGQYFNGYLTEIYMIDGSALDPTYFGEFNTDTGVWEPKEYIGTFGTNGFYLNFSDNSTIDALGTDFSGNGNTWDDNGFSVTAGAGNDSLVDTCTLFGTDTGIGGEVRGNYTTWNALDRNSSGTLANGNLDWTSGTTAHYGVRGTMSPPSGKWYFEVTASAATSVSIAYGIGMANAANPLNQCCQGNTGAYILYGTGTSLELEAAGVQGNVIAGASIGTNDVIQVAYDVDASKMWVGKNNTYYDSSGGSTGDPATGANPSFSSLLANLFPFVEVYNSTVFANFGQRPFAYTAPSGFKALCTQNLPDPTIEDGGEYFNTVLWTGDGSASRDITSLDFQPDWVWIKDRSNARSHRLFDSVRGAGKRLVSNGTDAESTQTDEVNGFISNGFNIGSGTAVNNSAETYVAWNWKANGVPTANNNSDGSITSTVSVSTESGFSIVTYTGTGSAATIGHGLGAVPRMIIVKNRDQADAWQVYHAANTANPETDYLVLNTTAATADAADRWNDTLPTSTVFSIGNGVEVNTNTEDYVAYCFAAIPGYSAFGSYTGNGSADGPFVFTGFRPAWVLIKRIDSGAENWRIVDTVRGPFNVFGIEELYPNLSAAEGGVGTVNFIDALSNGFKLRNTGSGVNASGGTYIFMAFSEVAFKYSLAR